jgi:hypothetical protein
MSSWSWKPWIQIQITLMWVPIRFQLFTYMRIRIQLFTFMRIRVLLLIRPPLLCFEPLKLLNFDLDTDPDPLITLMRTGIRIQLPKIMRIRTRYPGQISREVHGIGHHLAYIYVPVLHYSARF